jgi:hypothetical protein
MRAGAGVRSLPQLPSAGTKSVFEMNPEIVRLFPHEREEHLDANCIRQLFTFESERREQLPFNE